LRACLSFTNSQPTGSPPYGSVSHIPLISHSPTIQPLSSFPRLPLTPSSALAPPQLGEWVQNGGESGMEQADSALAEWAHCSPRQGTIPSLPHTLFLPNPPIPHPSQFHTCVSSATHLRLLCHAPATDPDPTVAPHCAHPCAAPSSPLPTSLHPSPHLLTSSEPHVPLLHRLRSSFLPPPRVPPAPHHSAPTTPKKLLPHRLLPGVDPYALPCTFLSSPLCSLPFPPSLLPLQHPLLPSSPPSPAPPPPSPPSTSSAPAPPTPASGPTPRGLPPLALPLPLLPLMPTPPLGSRLAANAGEWELSAPTRPTHTLSAIPVHHGGELQHAPLPALSLSFRMGIYGPCTIRYGPSVMANQQLAITHCHNAMPSIPLPMALPLPNHLSAVGKWTDWAVGMA
ncbi:unnamed protein product, partial [Closterium sp. Naga37s-1]